MALVINTNIASLSAQRGLGKTQDMLSRSLQRLSTGLRINSAKDDAAGLAISTRMTSEIRGLNQAVRNANDGVSLAQTAEGAMQETGNILQRIRELAVQAANSTNTDSDRNSLNLEVQQLISEYDRIASETEFNGQKLLTGSFSGNFQIGASVGQTISIAVSDMRGTAVGATSTYTTVYNEDQATLAARIRGQYAGAFSSSTINGVGLTDVAADNNSLAKINAINAVSGSSGVSAFSHGNGLNSAANMADGAASSTGDFVINGVEIGSTAGGTAAQMVAAINAKTSETGVTAVGAAAADLILVNNSGEAITVNVKTANVATITGFAAGETTVAAGANGAIVLSTDLGGAFTVDADATAAAMGYTDQATLTAAKADKSVVTMAVTSVSDAYSAMLTVDEALMQISTERSTLGAVQNRFESTIANLQNVSENLSAANSRILDADFAAETAELTKTQILQQAGVAMLAQANMLPQTVLSLLQ